jgi:16S rRNA (uracil1498-N3)-methyltransferase
VERSKVEIIKKEDDKSLPQTKKASTMQRFFAESTNIEEGKIFIYGNDVNHMKNSLRMKVGEQLEVCDSSGMIYRCQIEEYLEKDSKRQELVAILKVEEMKQDDAELTSKIILFQGLPKGDKMDLIIQKAVELGVHQIVPMSTARTIVKLDEKKSAKKVSRWNNISESAAKQSGRGFIPKVHDVMNFSQALEYAKRLDIILLPYELAQDMDDTKKILKGLKEKNIGVFIGPEGGFEHIEVEKAIEVGGLPITLGKRILRTETAAITMLSILMFEVS